MLTKKLIYMHKGAVTLAKYLQNFTGKKKKKSSIIFLLADMITLNTMRNLHGEIFCLHLKFAIAKFPN